MNAHRERRSLRREPQRRKTRRGETERRGQRQDRHEREYLEPRHGGGIRQIVVLITVAFMVTLGVVIGTRLSSDAIAVLVGVIAGVAASIPCALLLLAVTRRTQPERRESWPPDADPYFQDRDDRYGDRRGGYPQHFAPPPVIVVTPGSAPQQIAPWSTTAGPVEGTVFNPYAYGGGPAQGRREFRVMGYEEPDDQADWEP